MATAHPYDQCVQPCITALCMAVLDVQARRGTGCTDNTGELYKHFKSGRGWISVGLFFFTRAK